jgi:hypothetical protein
MYPHFYAYTQTYINTYIHSRILSIYLFIYGSTSLVDIGSFFRFLILYTAGRTHCTGDQPVARPLSAHRTAKTKNNRTQTSMPQTGFEPTTPVFQRKKSVHALDRAVTMIGRDQATMRYIMNRLCFLKQISSSNKPQPCTFKSLLSFNFL